MARTVILYALALGIAATVLAWLEYRFLVRSYSAEVYILIVALGGVALGAWLARMLTPQAVPRGDFIRNDAAVRSLGLSPRELEVLVTLAAGDSNKAMARKLGISPHTVKTHVGKVCEKLGVERRGQAVDKARFLSVIP